MTNIAKVFSYTLIFFSAKMWVAAHIFSAKKKKKTISEAVLTRTHNLCFEQKYEEYQIFYLKIFIFFLVVKFSVYLNRRVFVTIRTVWSVFAGHSVGRQWSKAYSGGQRRLTSQRGCSSWSESLLGAHHHETRPYNFDPLKPLLFSKTGVYRGMHYFCSKT